MTRSKVRVTAPEQGAAEVTIFRANGSTEALSYTTQTGSTLHEFPVTVALSTSTDFWVPEGPYVVSAVIADVEMAGGYGDTRALYVSNDGWILRPDAPAGTGGGGGGALADLTDVDLTGVADGDTLAYTAGEWLPVSPGDATTLAGLEDVTITSAAAGDILRHDGTDWVDVVGTTHFQAADADLAAIAALTSAANKVPYATGAGEWALADFSAAGRELVNDANAAAQRTTLGLDTIATQAASAVAITGGTITGITDLAVADGGTGASTAAAARTNLGFDETGISDGNVLAWSASGSNYVATTVLAPSATFAQAQAVNAQTGTTYTLVAADAGKLITLSNASAITLTLPQDSDATIAVGTYVDLFQLGAGQVTVAAGTGATLRNGAATAKSGAQYASFGVQKISANTWRVFGQLAAA